MPRVNWSLSPEAKAVFDAYQKERGFKNQDEAINAMILEFGTIHEPLNGLVAVDSSGKIVNGRGDVLHIAGERPGCGLH